MSILNLIDSSCVAHRFTSSGKVDLPQNLDVKIVRPLGYSQTPRVFLASMTTTCVSPSDSVDVVVKLANKPQAISELEVEEWAYKKLEKFQQISIPKCYGLHEGSIHGKTVKLLLLEYCIPDPCVTSGCRLKLQNDIMFRMSEIHKQGIFHGNLTDSSHVIVQDGLPRIISFSKAMVHKPQCKGIPYVLPSNGRDHQSPFCEELSDVAFWYGFNMSQLPISE